MNGNRPIPKFNMDDPSRYLGKEFFTYDVGLAASLAAGGSTELSIQTNGDSDFFWTKLNVHALVGGVATTRSGEELCECNALITNQTSGRAYMNKALPLANISGNGQLPFILPIITVIEAKSQLSIALLNIGNDAYSVLEISLIGIKAYLINPN